MLQILEALTMTHHCAKNKNVTWKILTFFVSRLDLAETDPRKLKNTNFLKPNSYKNRGFDQDDFWWRQC